MRPSVELRIFMPMTQATTRRASLTATLLGTLALALTGATVTAAQDKAPQDNKESDAKSADMTTDPVERPYIVKDGKVDFGTYNGYRRYHSSCHVCHGPDGLGSTFAPNLTESLKRLDYYQFLNTVTNGKQSAGSTGNKVMPAFGTDPNVMLYINDIYGYLKARSDGKIDRGRPEHLPVEATESKK